MYAMLEQVRIFKGIPAWSEMEQQTLWTKEVLSESFNVLN